MCLQIDAINTCSGWQVPPSVGRVYTPAGKLGKTATDGRFLPVLPYFYSNRSYVTEWPLFIHYANYAVAPAHGAGA